VCAFYRQIEFCITLFGLVEFITLLFVSSDFFFVCSFSSLDLVLSCAVVVVSLVGYLLFWITWMSQREQPDRECKQKRQVVVSNPGDCLDPDNFDVCSDRSDFTGPLFSDITPAGFSDSHSNTVAISNILPNVPDHRNSSSLWVECPLSVVPDTVVERPAMSDDDGARDRSGASSGPSGDHDLRSLFQDFLSGLSRLDGSPRSRTSDIDVDLSRQISSLAPHKDGVDIAKYIRKLEADLRDIGCPERRWKSILLQKLQSKTASSVVAGIDRDSTDYEQVKEILLDALGSSLTALGAKLTSEFSASTRAMTPLDKYVHLKSLIDSVDMMCRDKDELLLFFACATFRASLPVAQRMLMDQRVFTSLRDLNKFALSINSSDSDRTSYGSTSRSFRNGGSVECFKCHKFGHRAHECRSSFPNHPVGGYNGKQPGVVCYTCHEPGHKSPDCPGRKSNDSNSDSRPDNRRSGVKKSRTYNTNWVSVRNGSPHVYGFVNGTRCQIVPDTGAEISVVPGCLVFGDQLTGESVEVCGWDGRPVTLDTAIVDFMFKGRYFKSEVAVAHKDTLCGRVLFSVPMESATAEHLLLGAAAKSDVSYLAAGQLRGTRSTQPSTQVDACSGGVASEVPSTSPAQSTIQEETVTVSAVTRSSSAKERVVQSNRESEMVMEANPHSFDTDVEFERLAAIDVPYVPPVLGVGSDGGISSDAGLLQGSDEDGDGAGVVGSADRDGPQVSPSSPPIPSSDDVVDLDDLQLCRPKLSKSVDDLVCALGADESLSKYRDLGAKKLNGYSFNDKLLMHTVLIDDSPVSRLVVPTVFRGKLLALAHDKTAHVGIRGMRRVLGKRFTWPGIHTDIVDFVKSCDVCLRINNAGNRKSKMIERRILCVPFESVCVDLVGPLPKGKRGAKYLFTYICLSSRWPDAVPMRTASAAEAAQCFIEIISRTGIPLRVLSDRGTIFLSKLMSGVCEMLGIDTVATSPYRPQSNGVVERMHGSLKPMLSKAVDAGVDWVEFLPLALFALRQVPNRDLGYSPHCLVYGRDVMGPLDVLYEGWVDRSFDPISVDDWLLSLNDRLAIIHDLAVANQADAIDKRAIVFNRNKQDKPLEVGSSVLMRVPGIKAALQAAWEGPYIIVGKASRVTYTVSKGDGHPTRIAHRDNLKVYVPRPLSVNAITLIAEEQGIDNSLLNCKTSLSSELCPGFKQNELDSLLHGLKSHFSDKPGLCSVGTCEIVLDDGAPVVNLPPRQIPVGIRDAVKSEIDVLLSNGIIVESSSDWASPLVPVRKKDGSVRICVDFRQLNSVTPLRRYWLPSLSEILERVGPNACLSTLDLTAGFHQLAMDDRSSEFTTFVCPFGKYRYLRMPFGLKNAPAIFQAVIEKVLKPVLHCCRNYVDDVVIYSRNWSEHLSHLRAVIECLGASGLTIKLKKCCFGRQHLIYLGHRIGAGSLSVPEHRVSALRDFARPRTKKQLRSFLGSMSYYRRFIPNFADCSSLLTPATSLRAPLRVVWTEEMTTSFCKLISLLCDCCVLFIPAPDDVFTLYTDASGMGIGGCLHISRDSNELPVGFFSRQLKPAEKNYSVSELESLAIVASLKHFEFFLYAKGVTVITDHKPCLSLVDGCHLNKRLLRFALVLQQFNVSLVYRPGKLHANADGMSRQAWPSPDVKAAQMGSSDLSLSQILAGGDVGGQKREDE